MKTITNSKIMRKIIIIPIIVLLLINFVMPNYSRAEDIGGVLLTPICSLLAALGDGVNWLLLFVSGETQGSAPFKTGKDAYNYLLGESEVEFGGGQANSGSGVGRGDHIEDSEESNDSTSEITKENKNNYISNIGEEVKKGISITVSKYKDAEEDEEIVTNVGVADIRITPIEIFAGKVALLDANFFQQVNEETYNNSKLGSTKVSPAIQLRGTISNWYQSLRLISIVGLLSVLAYIGIRIIISSAASDKAKYKQMLGDWLIALCLIFFLHYIMVFTMTMVDEITKIFVGDTTDQKTVHELVLSFREPTGEMVTISSSGETSAISQLEDVTFNGSWWDNFCYGLWDGIWNDIRVMAESINGFEGIPIMYSTNIVGLVRVKVASQDVFEKLTYTIMYLAMTGYTLYFLFIYIKRLITLILLTMIAPLVALTYPMDKMRDGKAQAFNYWLKEYLINAILPIIHLVLYKVLISSAIDLVTTLPIYALAVMAFIVPAEKIVKNMFGIRSDTAPSLGGFAGGALAAHAVSNLAGKVSNKIKGGGKNSNIKGKERIRTKGESSGLGGSKESSIAEIAGKEKQGLLSTKQYNEQRKQGNNEYKQQRRNVKAQTNLTPEQRKAQLEALKKQNKQRKKALKLNRDNTGRIGHNAWEKVRRRYSLPKGSAGVKKLAGMAAKSAGKTAIKTVSKGVVTGAGAIMGGSIGLAGGIVSGDLSDAWKGLAGGAAAGGLIGNAAANKVEEIPSNISRLGDELYYGDEEAERRREEKDFANNYDNIKYMEKYYPEMSGKEITKELKTMSRYQESGVTDIRQLDEMRKLEAKKYATGGATQAQIRKDIINTGKLARKLGESGFQDEKKRKAAQESLANAYIKKQNMTVEDAQRKAAQKMKEAGEIVGFYRNDVN